MAALVIENEEAIRLAHEIAESTGQPVEAAVVMALRSALLRQEERRRPLLTDEERASLWQSLLDLQKTPERTPGLSVEDLYNDEGLPG